MAIPSLDEEKANEILKQVEFYLSDSNLPRDNFLLKSIKESEDGMMSLSLICTFTRMRQHLGFDRMRPEEVPDETLSAVAEILRKSTFLRVSEDGKKVGRNTEISKLEEVLEQVETRTVAVSPLEYNAKHDDVEAFFNQHGKVNSVRLPRHVADKRCFSGTALIEFATEEDAKNVLSQTFVYAGVELEIRPKKDYDSEREKKMKEIEDSRSSFGANNRRVSQANENYPKGVIVQFKLRPLPKELKPNVILQEVGTVGLSKPGEGVGNIGVSKLGEGLKPTECVTAESGQKTLENVKVSEEKSLEGNEKENGENLVKDTAEQTEEQITNDAAQENEENVAEDAAQEGEEEEEEDEGEEGEEDEEEAFAEEKVSREDIKEAFQCFGPVKYVDFRMGDESGYIRFEEAEAAQKAHAAAVLLEAGGFVLKNYITSLELVTGDAERDYWIQFRANQERHHQERQHHYHHRDFRGGRGRGRFNRGRRSDGKRPYRGGFGNQRPRKAQRFGRG